MVDGSRLGDLHSFAPLKISQRGDFLSQSFQLYICKCYQWATAAQLPNLTYCPILRLEVCVIVIHTLAVWRIVIIFIFSYGHVVFTLRITNRTHTLRHFTYNLWHGDLWLAFEKGHKVIWVYHCVIINLQIHRKYNHALCTLFSLRYTSSRKRLDQVWSILPPLELLPFDFSHRKREQ